MKSIVAVATVLFSINALGYAPMDAEKPSVKDCQVMSRSAAESLGQDIPVQEMEIGPELIKVDDLAGKVSNRCFAGAKAFEAMNQIQTAMVVKMDGYYVICSGFSCMVIPNT